MGLCVHYSFKFHIFNLEKYYFVIHLYKPFLKKIAVAYIFGRTVKEMFP